MYFAFPRLDFAPGTTRGAKGGSKKNSEHDLSEEDSSSDEKDLGNQGPGVTDKQLESVSLLVKSAVSAAVTQVLPLANFNSPQNASGSASSATSAQLGDVNNPGLLTNSTQEEEGEVPDEQMDCYEWALVALLGNMLITGPEMSDIVGRLLERCLGAPLDEKVVQAKHDAFPRPANLVNLSSPHQLHDFWECLNGSSESVQRNSVTGNSKLSGGWHDRCGTTSGEIARTKVLVGCSDLGRERLPEQVTELMSMYVELMDSLIIFVRAMADLTSTSRKMFRSD